MLPRPEPVRVLQAGLWSANAGLVQLLGLCPLLAVSTGAVHALGLGVATVVALTLSNFTIASVRRLMQHEVRLPAMVLVIAAIVTAIELAMYAFLPALHAALGLFLPLIVTNCAILARAETFAARNSPALAALDGFAVGLGFLGLLFLLGALREVIGQGTLFAGAGELLHARGLELRIADGGFLLALLPPGAFVLLALLIALKNRISRP